MQGETICILCAYAYGLGLSCLLSGLVMRTWSALSNRYPVPLVPRQDRHYGVSIGLRARPGDERKGRGYA